MERSLRKPFVIRALFAVMLALLAIVPAAAAQQTQTGEMTPVELVEKVSPAVVTVINEQTVSDTLGNQETVQAGAGTGFIIDDQGHIVTNWHVVTGGTSFSVIMADGTQVDAKLIGQDPRDDLAVVQIDASKVTTTVPLGDSSQLKQGQTVLAIGSPLGEFGNTVPSGIVSALNRDQLENPNSNYCQNYTNLIQHDAPINPGNSGGPLFNLKGEVVGVNTLGIPTLPDGTPVQGIFFAVPSNTVKAVVNELIQTGHISLPYIGITLVELNPQIASINNLPVDHGIYVASVEPGSPAATAGLQQGDIITAGDGKKLSVENSLSEMLINYEPGDTVTMDVLRNGQEGTVNLTFGEVDPSVFEQCTLQGAG
jgi:S1-C subfamily serine protease